MMKRCAVIALLGLAACQTTPQQTNPRLAAIDAACAQGNLEACEAGERLRIEAYGANAPVRAALAPMLMPTFQPAVVTPMGRFR